jgi:hypothetical protein
MRYIAKPAESDAAACIRGFIEAQQTGRASGISWEELRLDYGSFSRAPQLRGLLIGEQKGLCAYTGIGLDGRLVERVPQGEGYSFRAAIEHLKSQQQCRAELEAGGGVVGRDLGEDLAYTNMVAAIEVAGTTSEHFGAAFRGDRPLPIIPTNPGCSSAFVYVENGDVFGTSADANTTIQNLNLTHQTLHGWRIGAIRAWLPLGAQTARDTLVALVTFLEDESRETMPEFSFVVAQIARAYLAMQESRT